MADRVVRIGLAVLAATGLSIGAWASASPRSFYDHFPGGGRTWVAVDGPYNEHLIRDFGDLNLAIGFVALVAAVSLVRPAVIAAAGAWLVYSLPHLVYHLRHTGVYDNSTDKVTSIVSLVGALVLPVLVLVFEFRRTPAGVRSGPRPGAAEADRVGEAA